MDNIQYTPATVLGGKGSHAPVLSVGKISILVIHIFENVCHCFFQNKKLPEDKRVMSIIYNFESLVVQAWITTHHDRLIALTFVEFFTEFKNKFLPTNWKDDLVATQITMQSLQNFLTWTESVCKTNTELLIARTQLPPRATARGVEMGIDDYRQHPPLSRCKCEWGANLEAWIQQVHLLDLENQNKRDEWLKIAQSTARSNSKGVEKAGGSNSGGSMAPGTSVASNNASMPAVLANTMNTQQISTPKLMQVEHDLLRAYRGCFQCRLFYAGHYAPECLLGATGRPTPEACKNMTTAAVLKAKATFEGKGSVFVAAVFEDKDDSDDFEMAGDEADEYVLNLLLPSDMWWSCCIDAPLTCAPTPIRVLIDHGSPPVLISSEIVEVLGLARRKLFKPFSVSGAFVDGKRSSDSNLTEYCKLRLQSPDSVWKAKVVNAVISLNLQTDIILGLDFLMKNKIVVDAELRTAIAKEDHYNLLNPPPAKPKQPQISHHK
ncbi:hypothetical protein L208DRAFT_1236327, partial [Tricholoma matsutake]